MPLKKSLLILSVSLAILSSCSKPEPLLNTVILDKNIEIKPRPRPVNLMPVKFDVVTKDNIDKFLAEQTVAGSFVFIAFSVDNYERMSLNVDELKRYIEQQKAIIIYYEEVSKNG